MTVWQCTDMTIRQCQETQKEQWIQDDTWKLIDERKKAKIMREQAKSEGEKDECCTKYRELDNKVKSKCRYDKSWWLELKGKEAQGAADKAETTQILR